VKRLLRLAPLAALLACGSNPSVIPSGDFSGPTGLAIAPLPERDLLFVANQGANELRAIILCNAPPNTPTTCTTKEDRQFLPGPIRLFAGSILAGERPLRLAGARLTDGANALHGAVLVAGSDPVLRVIDAANVFAASRDRAVTAEPPREVPLPDTPVDVVAADVPAGVQASTVTAVVATQAPAGGAAALTVLTVSLDASGLAQATPTQQCAIGFVPTRLALIPGGKDDVDVAGQPKHVYVADGTPGGTPGGTGDGAVEVSIPDIPACGPNRCVPATAGPIPLCTVTRRLPASDPADSPRRARPLRSLALSPALLLDQNNTTAPAGNFMLGVTAPDASLCADRGVRACDPSIAGPGVVCADQGVPDCGRGRIVILGNNPATGQSALLAVPGVVPAPTATNPFVAGPPMAPLRPPAPAREVAFLGRGTCPPATGDRPDLSPPCTSARIGVNTPTAVPTVKQRATIGLATTEDGSTVFIDVLARRFFNDLRDTLPIPFQVTPTTTTPPLLPSPVPAAGQEPTALNLQGAGSIAGTQATGWLNAGVTRQATFRVAWHVALPGLESVGGRLSRSGTGPIVLTLAGMDLTRWITSPELQLSAGDFVRVISYSPAATCADLAATPLELDIPISAVHPNGGGICGSDACLELQPVHPGFDPDPACFASGDVGGTFGVHAGDTAAGAWLVSEDNVNVLGRFPHGGQFVVTGPRFDYPLDFAPETGLSPPPPANTFAFSFNVNGPAPTFAGTFFFVQTFDGTGVGIGPAGQPLSAVSSLRDLSTAGVPGFAGPILVYDTQRTPDQIVFTAITGSNSLMNAIPAQFGVTANAFFLYY